MTRSAFARKAFKDAVKQVNNNLLEINIRKGMSVILESKQNIIFGSQNRNVVINEKGRGEMA
jgi:hypothetical protein